MPADMLDRPDHTVVSEALTWPERAKAATITDEQGYHAAAELLLGIKDLRKKIADTFDPHCRRAFEAHRALTKEKADAEAPLTQAETILKTAIRVFDAEQDSIRREQQRLADAAAHAAAETDALERAAALETAGRTHADPAMLDEAYAILETPVTAIAAPIAKMTPKIAGITVRKTWAFRIVNASLIPRQYLAVDETKIRGVVRALGAAANIPGVEVFEETSVAAGRR